MIYRNMEYDDELDVMVTLTDTSVLRLFIDSCQKLIYEEDMSLQAHSAHDSLLVQAGVKGGSMGF
jgi:hypothetical protein